MRNCLMLVMGCVVVQAGFVQMSVMLPSCSLRGRHSKIADGGDVVRAGIVAVEEIEELDERQNLPAFADLERTADPQVRLYVRCTAKLVQAFGHSVHRDSTCVSGVRDGERARTLRLGDGGQFETAGNMKSSSENEAMRDVFTGRAIVSSSERMQRIANSVHIVKEFAEQASPGFRLGERVVCRQVKAVERRCPASAASASCSWNDCQT